MNIKRILDELRKRRNALDQAILAFETWLAHSIARLQGNTGLVSPRNTGDVPSIHFVISLG